MGMHITAFMLGLGSLLVSVATKFTPLEWLEKLGDHHESETGESLVDTLE